MDLLGWTGAVLLLVAFALVSNGLLCPKGIRYQFLNVAGGLFLLANNVFYGAYPSGFVNLVWSGVAVIMVVQGFLKKGPS